MVEKEILPNKGPHKVLVEGFQCRILNGMFHITFQSGEESFTFALPLQASKGLGRAILNQIEEIEKKTGQKVQDIRLSNEPVPSPMSADLKKDGPNKDK